MSHSQAMVDAHLRLSAARDVVDTCMFRLQSTYKVGSSLEIEMARQGVIAAAEAMADALIALLYQKLYEDGIDPITRRTM